jgi:membrane associated rhomboid family serine protease
VFPIRDDNPQILTPIVTYGLIGLTLVAWARLQGLGGSEALASSVCQLGLIPAELLGSAAPGTRVPLGDGRVCVLAESGQPLTLLTHMFLHAGWMHLIGNLWFLWIFGDNVEDSMGHLRFLVFYVVCGLAAAAAQMLSAPGASVPMVSASGAIGGVMGAYVILYPRVWVHLLARWRVQWRRGRRGGLLGARRRFRGGQRDDLRLSQARARRSPPPARLASGAGAPSLGSTASSVAVSARAAPRTIARANGMESIR